jgi:hypothetical protein
MCMHAKRFSCTEYQSKIYIYGSSTRTYIQRQSEKWSWACMCGCGVRRDKIILCTVNCWIWKSIGPHVMWEELNTAAAMQWCAAAVASHDQEINKVAAARRWSRRTMPMGRTHVAPSHVHLLGLARVSQSQTRDVRCASGWGLHTASTVGFLPCWFSLGSVHVRLAWQPCRTCRIRAVECSYSPRMSIDRCNGRGDGRRPTAVDVQPKSWITSCIPKLLHWQPGYTCWNSCRGPCDPVQNQDRVRYPPPATRDREVQIRHCMRSMAAAPRSGEDGLGPVGGRGRVRGWAFQLKAMSAEVAWWSLGQLVA